MTDDSARPTKRLSALQWLGLFVLAAFLAGAMVGFIDGMDRSIPQAVRLIVVGLLVAGGLWVSVIYWLRLDEAAKEAHKFAWYWGGSTGLLVSGLAVLALTDDGMTSLLWPGFDPSPANYLMTGALGVVSAQILGYLVVWAGWWLWNSRS